MDFHATLTWVLARTGASVWWTQKDENASIPAVVYQIVNDDLVDRNHDGLGSVHQTLVQLTLVANTESGFASLISGVKTQLDRNVSDFIFTEATGLHRETKEAEDVYVCFKEYLLQWRATS